MFEIVGNRCVFVGDGSVERAIALLVSRGHRKALFVHYSDDSAYVNKAIELAVCKELDCVCYEIKQGEPNLSIVDAGTALCKERGCDCVIGCGGGSVLDSAKLVAMLATNEGSCEDYQLGNRTIKNAPLRWLAIPTTAGTGSESTKVSVIYNENHGFKKSISDVLLVAPIVALDPLSTATMPPRVVSQTGMDAIIHAVESFVSLNANEISSMYSLKSLSLLINNFEDAYKSPSNVIAREKMLIGSYLAGLALSAGAGLAHIVGQPIGAIFDIPHGQACSAVFLPSLEMNKAWAEKKYIKIAHTLGVDVSGKPYDQIFENMVERFAVLMKDVDAPISLSDCIDPLLFDMEAVVGNIVESMSAIQCNPRPTDENLYREVLELALGNQYGEGSPATTGLA